METKEKDFVLEEINFVEVSSNLASWMTEHICQLLNTQCFTNDEETEYTSDAQEMYNRYYDQIYNEITDYANEC